MALITGSGSFTRYRTSGDLPEDFMETLHEKITRHAFRKLDEASVAEKTAGWVNIMNMFDHRFDGLEFLKEPYIALALRRDERKVPKTALKQYCLEAEEAIKAEENLEFLPKGRRADIEEAVRLRLLKRAIPVAKTYDLIWNYAAHRVIFGSTSNRICDEFVELFLQTFDLQLRPVYPYTLGVKSLEENRMSPDLLDGLIPSRFVEEA